MPKLCFSRAAEADLLEIGSYTQQTWGEAQAIRYLNELESCCRTIAAQPTLGRICDDVRRGLRRIEHGMHVIFYRAEKDGILVVRVLHQQMLPEKHEIDGEES